jgi:hypothetical protein
MASKPLTPEELAKLDQAFLNSITVTTDDVTSGTKKMETYLIVIIALLAFLIFVRLTYLIVRYSLSVLTTIRNWVRATPKEQLVITK